MSDHARPTMERFLEKLFRPALEELGAGPDIPIKFEVPQQESHGDLSTNIAMTLAKELKRPPRDLAQEIISRIKLDNGHLKTIEIAGPGFINIAFSKDYVVGKLRDLIAV